ncbi:MAG: adenylate/guanylate cyclase domain-containing protein, partial [Stenotrophobium sp.]
VLSVAVGMTMAGMAIAFILAEPKSPITRAFSVAFGVSGLAAITEIAAVYMYPQGSAIPWFARFPFFFTISTAAYPLWLLRVAHTAQPTPRAMLWITRCVRLQWVMIAAYFVFASIYADARLHEFYFSLGKKEFLPSTGSRILAALTTAGTVNLTIAGAILFTQRIDPAERRRVLAFALSFFFLGGVFLLPAGYNLLICLFGVLIFLVGAMRYNVMQGESGQFMSRFLSPQVAELVRRKGLAYTMQPQVLDITVICCDLRGFTHFCQMLASEQIITLLNEYYDAVGAVVAESGATINNYAGDGILILMGAPLPVPGHAGQSLDLARRVLEAAKAVTRRWTQPDAQLGAGLGLASGRVTVGAIGSRSRMEYTVVGQAVNLASRLCSHARDGEILVDARTTELAGMNGLESHGSLSIKGMHELPCFVVTGSERNAPAFTQ